MKNNQYTLKQARQSRGYNQQEMADMLRMNLGRYQSKERGQVSFSLHELEKISMILDYSFAYEPPEIKKFKTDNVIFYPKHSSKGED